jgi:anti-anti-sigma factor
MTAPSTGDPHVHLVWAGTINWQATPDLRPVLFDALEVRGRVGVELDVRAVTSIDRSGIALLIGANHRAAAMGRQLILIDRGGPVTTTLANLRLLRAFRVTQVIEDALPTSPTLLP